MLGPATAYGRHWLIVMRAVCQWAGHLLEEEERRLIAAFTELPASWRDDLGRLLLRRQLRLVAGRETLPADWLAACRATGWLRGRDFDEDPIALVEWLSLAELGRPGPRRAALRDAATDRDAWSRYRAFGPFIDLTPSAQRLVATVQLLAFGAGRQALEANSLVRLALGHFQAPAGSPLAQALAGEVCTNPCPYTDRSQVDALLAAAEARHAGKEGDPAAQLAAVTDRLQPLIGAPLSLRDAHHRASYLDTRLLYDLAAALPADDPRRQQAWRLLRQLPLDAALSRRLWRRLWQEARPALRPRIAAAVADWAIWRQGERWRWQLRASGRRLRNAAEPWRKRRLSAWLDRSGERVVAEGELVEAHVLRRLGEEGWQGLHAEGGFWLGLALCLAWPILAHPEDRAAPLAVLPDDWRRHGFLIRRRAAWNALARRIASDANVVLQSSPLWPQLQQQEALPLVGLPALPEPAALQAVCRHLPGRALSRLVAGLLEHPIDAGGLPDLVVWRDEQVALWEVKSPGDSLGDQQRAWLAWFAREGIDAGVVHLDERPRLQHDLFGSAQELDQRRRPAKPPRQRRAGPNRPEPATAYAFHQDPAPRATAIASGAQLQLSDGRRLPLANEPLCGIEQALRLLAEADNPARCALARCDHWGMRAGRRAATAPRWYRLPADCWCLVLIREEASPEGGIRSQARFIQRRAGWLIDRGEATEEPALVTDPTLPASIDAAFLSVTPPGPPPRLGDHLQASPQAADIDAQIALLGSTPYCLRLDGDSWTLALPADTAILWTASTVERGVLTFAMPGD